MPRVKTTACVPGNKLKGVFGIKQQARACAAPRGGFDGRKTPPWRKTVSIFKQPVTLVHTTSKDTKPAPQNELNAAKAAGTGRVEKPKQVFWSKRLDALCAMMPLRMGDLENYRDSKDDEFSSIAELTSLPSRIQPVGPDISENVAVASLNSALQTQSSAPITGQTYVKRNIDSNPGVFTNPDQPLVQAVVIQENDIMAQEKRVMDARSRLEEARKHFG